MSDQLSMFDPLTPIPADGRVCRTCRIESVVWRPRDQTWSLYCGSNCCRSPIRLCKFCDQPYDRAEGGTRFCSPRCRDDWHYTQKAAKRQTRTAVPCPRCRLPASGRNIWGLCGDCWQVIARVAGRLREHHVPVAAVVRLIDDPVCQNPGCRRPLLTSGRTSLRVDHDHRCCHEVSCGRCIRGFLCNGCNVALGFVEDD
ncbi:MAG TPA: endonuclease domain-containing protein, partial [Candidatus Dormibacteraeota bacterium]|nr:endonuclease domain-containing protein [Candidatus Dormibacteraeota bacterium]